MTLRLSTGLRNFVLAGGSFKDALQGGKIEIYSGTQPATADTAVSGTLLCTVTDASGTRTNETLATGSVELTGGGSGSVTALTVDGVSILDATVTFNGTLTQTATDLATAINRSASNPEYSAAAAGTTVTITAKCGSGATPNTFVVDATCTTITTTDVAMANGVTAVNGLKLGTVAAGVLAKHASQPWSGVAVANGTAGWFRFTGAVADAGTTDVTESTLRMDGAISTSGAQLNMSSTSITTGATQTISSFPITLPAA